MKKTLYNINFLLTDNSDLEQSGLKDSFINIYAYTLNGITNVDCLYVSPNHHFMEEFKEYIANYDKVLRHIESKSGTDLLIEGIKAVNILTGQQIPIYISSNYNYIDENVALFGMSKIEETDNELLYSKLNDMNIYIVNYGIIKGAEKIKVNIK